MSEKKKPKVGPKIEIFVKYFLTSDFITAWCQGILFLAKICVFLKNRNSLLSFFGPVFTPKASEENVGRDTFQFLTKK